MGIMRGIYLVSNRLFKSHFTAKTGRFFSECIVYFAKYKLNITECKSTETGCSDKW